VGARRGAHQHLGRLLFLLKRGLIGVYQHVDKKHLNRYLAEFDFRQNTRGALGVDDIERAKVALRGMVGKRLTYRDSAPAEDRKV
jgi:hypothetical protein